MMNSIRSCECFASSLALVGRMDIYLVLGWLYGRLQLRMGFEACGNACSIRLVSWEWFGVV